MKRARIIENGHIVVKNPLYVHAPDKSSGHREQRIEISYDLVGILPAAMLNGLQNGETA